jgi:hypothetical protein
VTNFSFISNARGAENERASRLSLLCITLAENGKKSQGTARGGSWELWDTVTQIVFVS